jgi:hypothetical protein
MHGVHIGISFSFIESLSKRSNHLPPPLRNVYGDCLSPRTSCLLPYHLTNETTFVSVDWNGHRFTSTEVIIRKFTPQ